MEIDIFLKVKIDDVEDFTPDHLYEYVNSQIFGGIVKWDNPFSEKNKFKRKELFIKKSK